MVPGYCIQNRAGGGLYLIALPHGEGGCCFWWGGGGVLKLLPAGGPVALVFPPASYASVREVYRANTTLPMFLRA